MDVRKIGLSTSAFGYSMGNTGKQTDRRNPEPWTIEAFVDFAAENGFGGIEAPLTRFIPDLNRGRLDALRAKLKDKGMFFLMDSEAVLDPEQIAQLIPLAKAFGSPIIRIKSSNILGCDRKKLGRPWREHIEHCVDVLKGLSSTLRDSGLKLAIENHQDLDSNDLKEIIERVGPDVVGVTFDIGNAFSVCEDPVLFARKLGTSILNVHLKEYKIFRSDNGFRLVRCPVGEGSVDFKSILPLLAEYAPDAKMVVELGALEARNVAWLDDDFWSEIRPRNGEDLIAFFQLVEEETIRAADDSWKTPWEKGAPPAQVVAYEVAELKASRHYLSTL